MYMDEAFSFVMLEWHQVAKDWIRAWKKKFFFHLHLTAGHICYIISWRKMAQQVNYIKEARWIY